MRNNRPPIWRWILTLGFVGVVAAGGYWYFYLHKKEAPTKYQTATVTRGEMVQTVTATGQLNPVVNVQVGSQISGRIQRIYVDYNSVVQSNQLIAEIDPSTYKVNVQRAEAQLAQAQANLALAEVQAKRSEALFKERLIPASDNDTAEAQLLQAQAEVMQNSAMLESTRVDLSRCTILAPVDGVVISRSVDVGQTVAASFNTPTLFLIANDLTKMQIDALVSEADIGGVEVGQHVDFTVDAYPGRTFRGQLSQIRYGAITNQNVVSYNCVVAVENKDKKLLPGMTANVSIILAERANVLRVPNAAFRYRPPEVAAAGGARAAGTAGPMSNGPSGGTGPGPGRGGLGASRGPGEAGRPKQERTSTRVVYVLPGPPGPGREPRRVEIKPGISDGITTEVLEGLDEGAAVVTALLTPDASRSQQTANPFGGGPFRRF